MKALITGGGGFLGLYITEQLVARGDQVRVFCRTHSRRFDELGVEWCAGDVRDPAAVEKACVDVDVVFHVAAIPGIWGPWRRFYSVNTLGTRVVIESCQKAGVSRLVYTSSPSVVYDGRDHIDVDESYPYPPAGRYLCHYPHSKALAEKSVLQANACGGLATVSLRPHLIWGPRDNHLIPRLIHRARRGRLRRVGSGENLVSMVYVENAASAHLQAADALCPGAAVAGQAYFINEPEPVNLWEWINELLTLAGLSVKEKTISKEAAWCLGAVMETVYQLFRLSGEPPMTRFVASQLSSSHYYDISKAVRDFGYRPIVSVQQGMLRLESELKQLADNSGRSTNGGD